MGNRELTFTKSELIAACRLTSTNAIILDEVFSVATHTRKEAHKKTTAAHREYIKNAVEFFETHTKND